MKHTPNQAVAGGVGGGGIAFIIVWALPQLTDLVIQPTEASALTVAFASVVAFLIRYLPAPKR